MVSDRFIGVLREVHGRLKDSCVNWAVVGSLGLALRKIPLEPHDVDIMSDERGAYEIERIFSEFVKERVHLRESELLRSHFGKLEIDGVEVEIMGDLCIKSPDGEWDELVDMKGDLQVTVAEGMSVPVLSLECEQKASLKLGRIERAELISEHLKRGESG